MSLPSFWNTGTVSVTANSATVTGQGTSWSDGETSAMLAAVDPQNPPSIVDVIGGLPEFEWPA